MQIVSLSTVPSAAFYVAGGTLSRDADCYVVRQADTDLYNSLLAGEYCSLLDNPQTGKSSLAVRTRFRLQQEGVRTLFLDLRTLGAEVATPEMWYLSLLTKAGQDLDLHAAFLAYWQERSYFSPVQRFFGALLQIGLEAAPTPLSVFIDEVDTVRSLPFDTEAFFTAIRKCYLGREAEPDLYNLTFSLLGITTPSDLISDTNASPLPIGKQISLGNFTAEEAAPLAQGLGANRILLLSRILSWTGGHPYRTQRLCLACAENGVTSAAEVDREYRTLFPQRLPDAAFLRRKRTFRRRLLLAGVVGLAGVGLAGLGLRKLHQANRAIRGRAPGDGARRPQKGRGEPQPLPHRHGPDCARLGAERHRSDADIAGSDA